MKYNYKTTTNTTQKVYSSWVKGVKMLAFLMVLSFLMATKSIAGGGLDSFYVVQTVPTTPIQTGASFVDLISYTWGNTTENGINAIGKITLPPNVVPSSGTVSSDFNTKQVQSVTYDAATNVVTIIFVNPLPAGSSGQLSLGLMFVNGTTPNGYTGNIVSSLTADNNKNSNGVLVNPSINTVSVKASATNGLSITKSRVAGGAINDTTIYKISVSQSGGNGYLNLKNPSLVDTLPAYAQFYSATAFKGSSHQFMMQVQILSPGHGALVQTQALLVIAHLLM